MMIRGTLRKFGQKLERYKANPEYMLKTGAKSQGK
jgi:hypothetical protein